MQSLREKLKQQETPLLGLNVNYGTPGIIETVGGHWDWVWIDGQHGRIEGGDVDNMVMACDLVGASSIVRVPSNQRGLINRALDTGASGVMVPQVDTLEEARDAVLAAKFPPLGERSYGGRRIIDREGLNYSATANDNTILMLQIESPQAVERVDAIAGMEGVDALFPGPDDIRLRLGYAMDQIEDALRAVAEACRAHGKIAVTVAADEAMAVSLAEMGYTMIVGCSDVGLLRSGSRKLADSFQAALGTAD